MRQWLRESISELLSLDGRMLLSFRTLLTRPGLLTREWRDGRRVRYVHPLRLYVVAMAIFFGVSFAVGLPPEALPDSGTLRGSGVAAYDAALRAFYSEIRWILTVVLVASVPAVALALGLLFVRRRLFFLQHLVFALHVVAFTLLVFTLSWAASFLGTFGSGAALALLAVPPLYLFLALRRVYGGSVLVVSPPTPPWTWVARTTPPPTATPSASSSPGCTRLSAESGATRRTSSAMPRRRASRRRRFHRRRTPDLP